MSYILFLDINLIVFIQIKKSAATRKKIFEKDEDSWLLLYTKHEGVLSIVIHFKETKKENVKQEEGFFVLYKFKGYFSHVFLTMPAPLSRPFWR